MTRRTNELRAPLSPSIDSDEDETQVTQPTKTLRQIWATELHLPENRVNINRAILNLGKTGTFPFLESVPALLSFSRLFSQIAFPI